MSVKNKIIRNYSDDPIQKKSEKEASYVQEKNQSVNSDELRTRRLSALESFNRIGIVYPNPVNFLIKKNVLAPEHLDLIMGSLSLNYRIFSQQLHSADPPWIFFASRGQALRIFPRSWFNSISRFENQLEQKYIQEAADGIVDIRGKHYLGLSENAGDAIWADAIDNNNLLRRLAFHARELVKLIKSKKLVSKDHLIALENQAHVMLQRDVIKHTGTDDEHLTFIHIFNSINFGWRYFKEYLPIHKNFLFIENFILPKIANGKLKDCVSGNLYFQRSLNPDLLSNVDLQIELLNKAATFDRGFFDYHYRLANLYLDLGNHEESHQHFKNALHLSPLNKEIWHDYGVFLNETHQDRLLSSVEWIYNNLYEKC